MKKNQGPVDISWEHVGNICLARTSHAGSRLLDCLIPHATCGGKDSEVLRKQCPLVLMHLGCFVTYNYKFKGQTLTVECRS